MRRVILGLAGLTALAARAAPVPLSIPAEAGDRALLAFSRQSGVEILFPFDELQQVRTRAVAGTMEPAQALDELLRGTHYVARRNERGTFIVSAEAKAVAAAPAVKPPAPPKEDAAQRMAPYMVRAQQVSTPGPAQASEVSVGNLDLPRTENDPLPYVVYTHDQIGRSGATNLDDFLKQEVLESDPAGLSADEASANGQLGFFNGSNNLNLRAFGQDETLVLVNGLPMPEVLNGFNQGGGDTSRIADVDLIPISLVERVEILPVSAAALYSGNPVGGVINIVLRPIENINEFTATYSNGFGRVDAPRSSYSFIHGQTLLGGKLNYRISLNYSRSTPPSEQELGFDARNLAEHPDIAYPPKIYPVPLYRATPNVFSVSGSGLFGTGTPNSTSVAPGADGSGGLAAFNGRQGVASLALYPAPYGYGNSPDSANLAYGRLESEQTYFGTVTYQVWPNVQVGLDGLYTHKVTHPGFDIFQGNLEMKADNPNNPFGQDVYVNLAEAAPKLGEGYDESRFDLYSGVAGLLVKLPWDWRLSADAQYSHSITHFRGIEGVDSVQWQLLVDEGLYNPLRDTHQYGPPQAFYDQALVYFGHRGQFLDLDNYQSLDNALRLINTDLRTPTGPASVSVGADYSIRSLASFNDNQFFGDGTISDSSGYWKGRTLQQLSAFGEGQALLLPKKWLPSWIKEVKLDAAARYNADNTAFGANVAPAFGLKTEFAGGLSLRASVSNTNRFPTATMSRFIPIPGGTGSGAGSGLVGTTIIDPLRGNSSYNVLSEDTPDIALRPEADVTESAGLVYQHGDVHRFRLSVDCFLTRKSGELAYLDPQDVITYSGLLPGRITRAPAAPGDPYGAGLITNVLTGNINLAWRHSQNWNTEFDYDWTEAWGGVLQLYARYVYFQRYDREVVPNSPIVDELDHPDTSNLDLVRHRINFGASWSNRNFGFGVDGQYYSSRILPVLLWPDQGSDHIGSYCPFGTFFKTDIGHYFPFFDRKGALTLQLRVNNLFNSALPAFPDNPSGTGVEPYGDWRGRVYSVSLTSRF